MPSKKYPRLAETSPKTIILDDYVEVGIWGSNIGFYRSLGYEDIEIGDKIFVDPRLITLKTQIRVNVKCPNKICGREFERTIYNLVECGHTYCRACLQVIDISNERFGHLIAKRMVTTGGSCGARWECVCDCGRIVEVSVGKLTHGWTKSCGYCSRAGRRNGSFVELRGETFGRLTVLELVGSNHLRNSVWLCECQCGNIIEVASSLLVQERTKSCGCLYFDHISGHPRVSDFMEGDNSEETIDQYNKWRFSVYKKDNYTCVICGADRYEKNIVAHHLDSYSEFPDKRTVLENGVTLCTDCHMAYHIGFMGNFRETATRESFQQFVEDIKSRGIIHTDDCNLPELGGCEI